MATLPLLGEQQTVGPKMIKMKSTYIIIVEVFQETALVGSRFLGEMWYPNDKLKMAIRQTMIWPVQVNFASINNILFVTGTDNYGEK